MANVKKRKTSKPAKPVAKKAPAQSRARKTQAAKPSSATAAAPLQRPPEPLPNVWRHTRATLRLLKSQWQFFVALTVFYALFNIVFVHNFAQDAQALKQQLAPSVHNNVALTGLGTYALLVVAGGNGGTTAYLYVLLIISSLACIWALRQHGSAALAGRVRLKESLYQGMYPLIPFILVIFALTIELVPLGVGGSLLSLVLTNGIAVTGLEQALWVAVFMAFAGVTVWLLSMSLFAMYIVTLPDGRPWQALKDSKRITKGKRLAITRRILVFGLVLLLVSACILVPIIIVAAKLAAVLLFLLGALVLPFTHAYFYGLYRELLDA